MVQCFVTPDNKISIEILASPINQCHQKA